MSTLVAVTATVTATATATSAIYYKFCVIIKMAMTLFDNDKYLMMKLSRSSLDSIFLDDEDDDYDRTNE